MIIIDTHAHIFPDKLAKIATDATRDFYRLKDMKHIGTTTALLKSGADAGVTKHVVFSTATSPGQVVNINNFIIAETKKHSELIGVGTMHRDFENIEGELNRLMASGIRGIKLHPDFQKFNIDDVKLVPLYRALDERGMFLITHAGDYRYTYSHPAKIRRVAELFPRLRIVAAHFGGWMMWELARRELILPNVYVDTSSTYSFVGPEEIRTGIRSFPDGHVFFGVDFPMWDHQTELDAILALKLPSEKLEGVLGKNFLKFYSGIS